MEGDIRIGMQFWLWWMRQMLCALAGNIGMTFLFTYKNVLVDFHHCSFSKICFASSTYIIQTCFTGSDDLFIVDLNISTIGECYFNFQHQHSHFIYFNSSCQKIYLMIVLCFLHIYICTIVKIYRTEFIDKQVCNLLTVEACFVTGNKPQVSLLYEDSTN